MISIEKYINKVDWYSLSNNKNLSEAFFERHIDKVDWNFLSKISFNYDKLYKNYINSNLPHLLKVE